MTEMNRRLFCCGSLSCRSFSNRSFCGSSRFFRTASSRRFLSGFLFQHVFVVINQFDKASFCVITQTVTGFQDTGISSGAIGDLYGDFFEQLRNRLFVLQIAEHYSSRVGSVFFCTVDQGFNVYSQCFRFCQRSEDSFVKNQRRSHIGQQGVAVRFRTS